jgi:hypothetical protein
VERVRQNTGSYGPAITVIAIVMLVSLILPLIARRPSRAQSAVPAVAAGTD